MDMKIHQRYKPQSRRNSVIVNKKTPSRRQKEKLAQNKSFSMLPMKLNAKKKKTYVDIVIEKWFTSHRKESVKEMKKDLHQLIFFGKELEEKLKDYRTNVKKIEKDLSSYKNNLKNLKKEANEEINKCELVYGNDELVNFSKDELVKTLKKYTTFCKILLNDIPITPQKKKNKSDNSLLTSKYVIDKEIQEKEKRINFLTSTLKKLENTNKDLLKSKIQLNEKNNKLKDDKIRLTEFTLSQTEKFQQIIANQQKRKNRDCTFCFF